MDWTSSVPRTKARVLAVANKLLQKAQEDYRADIAFAVQSGEIDADTAQDLLNDASESVVEFSFSCKAAAIAATELKRRIPRT